MKSNHSPWLDQLRSPSTYEPLSSNTSTDIAIIGAGIAGVSTAYFILKQTNFQVHLIEASHIAHGATGHNAGLLFSHFEKPLANVVSEFSLDLANQAQVAMNSSWQLLAQIYEDTNLHTPYLEFISYTGCQSLVEVFDSLQNLEFQYQPMPEDKFVIATEISSQIPAKYAGRYTTLPQSEILNLLETDDHRYIAMHTSKAGCLNSASFCQELIAYLCKQYSDRFIIHEQTPIRTIQLRADDAIVKNDTHYVTAKKVILCTNGYKNFQIINHGQQDIQQKFQKLVRGLIGYMAAYTEEPLRFPGAISYEPLQQTSPKDPFLSEPYYYITRRPFQMPDQPPQNLITVAGPEAPITDNSGTYSIDQLYPQTALAGLNSFLASTYKYAPPPPIEFAYQWHGLMAYTPNGIRCIGPEPLNPLLLYNLGCNGIGILPSIYGGHKLARILSGESLPPSIFDAPKD